MHPYGYIINLNRSDKNYTLRRRYEKTMLSDMKQHNKIYYDFFHFQRIMTAAIVLTIAKSIGNQVYGRGRSTVFIP